MTGATITVKQVIPQQGKNLIYFTGTTDGSAKLDFSAYSGIDWVDAVVASSLAKDAVAAYSAGGDLTLTSTGTAVKGLAIVTL